MDTEGRHYFGIARIDLTKVNFEHALELGHRELNPEKVIRLVDVFRREGCHRLNCSHFLKVVVDRTIFVNALKAQAVRLPHQPPVEWDDVPTIELPQLTCLNGLHRVAAARQFLDADDLWWIASIYTEALPKCSQQQIVEEFQNEQPFTDGEIFRNIRLYNKSGEGKLEQRWWARLSASKRQELNIILKDVKFARVFDDMLPWPGLWQNMQIGSLRRITRLKCNEELVRYLEAIVSMWLGILRGTGKDFDYTAVDAVTVRQLEALCPKTSMKDADTVESLFRNFTVFPKVHDPRLREILRSNIGKCRMILSMYTFSEGLNYLEPCARALRYLLPTDTKRSIYSSSCAIYKRPNVLQLEHGEEDTRSRPQISLEWDRNIGYQQLWLFALRNFSALAKVAPTAENLKNLGSNRDDLTIWYQFAALAISLGFRTELAIQLIRQSPEHGLASPLSCNTDPQIQENDANRGTGDSSSSLLQEQSVGRCVSTSGQACLTREQRCGRPLQSDHNRDRRGLYLPSLCEAFDGTVEYVSTFYCKSVMFDLFFDVCREIPSSPVTASPRNLTCAACSSFQESLTLKSELIQASELKIGRLEEESAEIKQKLDQVESISQNTVRHLEAKLASVENEYQRLKSCQIQDQEKGRRDASALQKIELEKDSQRNELMDHVRKAQISRDEIASLQTSNTKLQSQLSQSQAHTAKHTTRIETLERKLRTTEDTLAEKEGIIQELRRDLETVRGELEVALRNNVELETRTIEDQTRIEELRQQIRDHESNIAEEIQFKENAAQDLYNAEVGRINDQTQFEIERVELVTEATTAVIAAQEKANLIKETFEQILYETAKYHLQLSTPPTTEFLLLRMVAFKEGAVFIRDRVLTYDGGDEIVQWLRSDPQQMSRFIFLIGMDRKQLMEADTTSSSLQRAWRARQVLWVIPFEVFAQVQRVWSKEQWDIMDQLEQHGFRCSRTNGQLQYVGNASRTIDLPSNDQQSVQESNMQLSKAPSIITRKRRRSSDSDGQRRIGRIFNATELSHIDQGPNGVKLITYPANSA